jgi:hypothetical protein
MTERNERVETLLRGFVLDEYRKEGRGLGEHLTDCPDLVVAELDANDGTYGCQTGCDYVRFEAVLTCPHGERTEWEWGDFGELAYIIEDLEAREART